MKKIMLCFVIGILLTSCGNNNSLNLPEKSNNNVRLNSTLTFSKGDNYFLTQDYILDISTIDSASSDWKGVKVKLSSKKDTVYAVMDAMPRLVNISLWVKGVPYSVLAKRSNKIDYTFTYDAHGKKPKRIQLAGQMNDWVPSTHPDLMLNKDSLYEVTINVSPGTYLYQMVIDGEWNYDKNNPEKVDNNSGKFNSVLHVPGSQDRAPVLLTKSFDKNTITVQTFNPTNQLYVYWQNYLLPNSNFVDIDGKNFTITLPKEAKKLDRSFIRVFSANRYGISNDLLIPLEKGSVLNDYKKITRFDKQAESIYFLIVDRFNDANKTNNHPMNRPDVNPKVDYQGGDIAGITQKIKEGYFQKLGFTTIWVSPIVQNPLEPYGNWEKPKTKFSGYHGYWPISSSKIDFRLGTDAEMRELVKTAHENNMNIIIDYVANHVHKKHPLYQRDSTIATPLHLPDGTLNVGRWNDHRLTTWFDVFLPTIDYSRPEIVNMMTDSAVYWIKKFNLDGFRHDACKHVNDEFWRMLTLKLKKEVEIPSGHPIYQIGESYGSPQLINSYVNTGMLDGQFDFNVFDDASSVFALNSEDFTRISNTLNASLRTYGNHNLMGYISGNQDHARFISYASGDVKFGEDSKAAGWDRKIGLTDTAAYDKLIQLNAFNLTIPGVPVLYYGDEIGNPGANDPDCRRFMRFGNQLNQHEKRVLNTVSKLGQLRKHNLALIYGDFFELKLERNIWAYARNYFNEEAIVVFNRNKTAKDIAIKLPIVLQGKKYTSTFGSKCSIKGDILKINVKANGVEILTTK